MQLWHDSFPRTIVSVPVPILQREWSYQLVHEDIDWTYAWVANIRPAALQRYSCHIINEPGVQSAATSTLPQQTFLEELGRTHRWRFPNILVSFPVVDFLSLSSSPHGSLTGTRFPTVRTKILRRWTHDKMSSQLHPLRIRLPLCPTGAKGSRPDPDVTPRSRTRCWAKHAANLLSNVPDSAKLGAMPTHIAVSDIAKATCQEPPDILML